MTPVAAYRSFSQLHENPRLLEFAATAAGRALIWLLSTALLWQSELLRVVPLFLAAAFIWPQQVKIILGLGSLCVLYDLLQPRGIEGMQLLFGISFILALLYGLYLAARNFPVLPAPVRRHPVIALHLVVVSTLLAAPPLKEVAPDAWPVLFLIISLLPFFAWRCGYLLLSARKRADKVGGFGDHLYYFLPLFDGSNVPYGKGHDYLSARQAHDAAQLSRARLAGLKLLVLAWLWSGARWAMDTLLYVGDAEPLLYKLGAMIQGRVPEDLPLLLVWGGLFADLVYATLGLAVFGHFVIGTLRLFGFNVFRNTYKPLLAQSIVDFWNRFYYYFKELLVEFFFYPTFLAYFKNSPRLRMFAAIMAAAFIGNAYYHLIHWLGWSEVSFWSGHGIETRVLPYLFYSFLLGLGVYVSMLREQARRGKTASLSGYSSVFSRLRALQRIAGVWLFFGLIRIWDVGPVATFMERTEFFISLFGL